MTWKIEKLGKQSGGNDVALCIKGFWLFSFVWDSEYKSFILFNHIIWDRS